MAVKEGHSKYINPVTDYGFKLIFTDEPITRGFLNDLLHNYGSKTNITKVTIVNNEQDEANSSHRRVIFDVHCTTDTGEEFVIEMQNDSQEYFSDRVVYYMARATSRQQHKGLVQQLNSKGNSEDVEWNYHLKNIYGVFFMNFKDPKRPKKFSHCALMDTDDHAVDCDVFQYWKIQMPFYREMEEKDCKTLIDKWIYNLSNMETMKNTLPFTDEQPLFKRLSEIAEYANLSEKEQRLYDESLDNYLSYRNIMKYQRKLGKEEGIEEGHAKGLAEAHEKNLNAAYNLFMSGALTLEQIANAMDLNLDELSNYIIEKQKSDK